MRLPKILAIGFALRRGLRELTLLREQLTRQTDLLERLATRFAPATPQTDPREVAASTGVDHLDPLELGLALEYVARTEAATGHRPDEEEILTYLADEKTIDLHVRLRDRERELAARERAR